MMEDFAMAHWLPQRRFEVRTLVTNQLTPVNSLSNSATPTQQLQAAIHRSIVEQFMPVPGAGPRAPHAGVVSASLIGMDLRSRRSWPTSFFWNSGQTVTADET
jgi:hypothetical protein